MQKPLLLQQLFDGWLSMVKSIIELSSVATIELDLAEHIVQVHGVDATGRAAGARTIPDFRQALPTLFTTSPRKNVPTP
jgi:hypothetical protein